MLIAALDPELYLKSPRTQRRMVGVLARTIRDTLGSGTAVERLAGHRLSITSSHPDTIERLSTVFGISAVEQVEVFDATDFDRLVDAISRSAAGSVAGKTFAVRPKRLGSHQWKSQDLAVALGTRLVGAGGTVDLSHPDVTVKVRIVDDTAYLTSSVIPAVGGLPAGTQGRALAMFSGGIDSPVAAYLVARRGVALDYLHFSLGCGQADHAAGIAHSLAERHGGGTDPVLYVAEVEHHLDEIKRRVHPRDRQMALKSLMYRASHRIAEGIEEVRALVTGESLGQVSTQTLDNLAALDRSIPMPVLRPLIGLDKQEIRHKAEAIGTYELSARTRELCDISDGARVSVSTAPSEVEHMGDAIADLVEETVMTAKATRLRDWMPGATS